MRSIRNLSCRSAKYVLNGVPVALESSVGLRNRRSIFLLWRQAISPARQHEFVACNCVVIGVIRTRKGGQTAIR